MSYIPLFAVTLTDLHIMRQNSQISTGRKKNTYNLNKYKYTTGSNVEYYFTPIVKTNGVLIRGILMR